MKQIKKIKSTPSTPPTFGVIDSLNSTSITDSLSANQGKILNDKINKILKRRFYKELSSSVSSSVNTVAYRNLGDLYIDVPAGRWLIQYATNYTTTGNGTGFIRWCVSTNSGSVSDKRYINQVQSNSVYLSGNYIMEFETTTRVYLLHAFAYTGSNTGCTLAKGDGFYSPIPYIEAIEL